MKLLFVMALALLSCQGLEVSVADLLKVYKLGEAAVGGHGCQPFEKWNGHNCVFDLISAGVDLHGARKPILQEAAVGQCGSGYQWTGPVTGCIWVGTESQVGALFNLDFNHECEDRCAAVLPYYTCEQLAAANYKCSDCDKCNKDSFGFLGIIDIESQVGSDPHAAAHGCLPMEYWNGSRCMPSFGR